MTNTLIIRKSKYNPSLILVCTKEKVYRIYFESKEVDNDIEYDTISDKFNQFEANLKLYNNLGL